MPSQNPIADGGKLLFRSTMQHETYPDNKMMGLTPSDSVPEPADQRAKTVRSVLSPLDVEVQRPTPVPTPDTRPDSPDAPPPITPRAHFAPSSLLNSLRGFGLRLRVPFPILLLNSFTSHPATAKAEALPVHSGVGHRPVHLANRIPIRIRGRVFPFRFVTVITPQAASIRNHAGDEQGFRVGDHALVDIAWERTGIRVEYPTSSSTPYRLPRTASKGTKKRRKVKDKAMGRDKQDQVASHLAAIRERVRERGMSVSTVAAPAPAASTAVAAAASMSISSSASSISGPAAVAGPGNLAADAETHKRKPLENDAPLSNRAIPLAAPSLGESGTSITGDGAAKGNAGNHEKHGNMDPSTSPPSTASSAATASPGRSTSASASASPAPNVVSDRKKPEHPLQHAWTIYFDSKTYKPDPAVMRKEGEPVLGEYERSLLVVGRFDTVEGFARYMNNLRLPSQLHKNANYHMFKNGIKPMWEDPANAHGGKYTLLFRSPHLLDLAYANLTMALIGDVLDPENEVCGIVASPRPKVDRIQVWTRGRERGRINEIGRRVWEGMGLEVAERGAASMEFQYNASNSQPPPNMYLHIPFATRSISLAGVPTHTNSHAPMLSPFNNNHNHIPPIPTPLRLASSTYPNAPGDHHHAASGPGTGFVLPTPSGAAWQYPNQPVHTKATGFASLSSSPSVSVSAMPMSMSTSMSTPMPMSALGVPSSKNITKPEGIRAPSLSPSRIGRG
ncbi:hypothetical protein JCM24511_04961 [Saitozyma sp. JCM 24511]|nr:hypothetical protein JCM24511_04961 [Saitozyma sp. JCM 24511]